MSFQLQKQQVEADLRHNLPSYFFPDDQWVYAADKKEPGAISDEIRKNWVWYRIGAEEFEPLNQCDGASTSNKEAFEEAYQNSESSDDSSDDELTTEIEDEAADMKDGEFDITSEFSHEHEEMSGKLKNLRNDIASKLQKV